MSLNISLQSARVGMNIRQGEFSMQSRKPELSLNQNHAKADIKYEHPKVIIDQYPSFASSGLKNFRDLTRQNAQEASANASQYTSKVASDGDLMAQIESGIDAIAHIAKRDFIEQKVYDVATIPKERPKIDVEGDVSVNWEKNWEGVNNGVQIQSSLGDLDINYMKGGVDVYLEQKNFVNIEYNRENKLDIKV